MNKSKTWNKTKHSSLNQYFQLSYFVNLTLGVSILCIRDFNIVAIFIHLIFFILSSLMLPYSIHFFDFFLEKSHDKIEESNEKEILIFGNLYKNIANNQAEDR